MSQKAAEADIATVKRAIADPKVEAMTLAIRCEKKRIEQAVLDMLRGTDRPTTTQGE